MGHAVYPSTRQGAFGCENTAIRQVPRVRRSPVRPRSDDIGRHVGADIPSGEAENQQKVQVTGLLKALIGPFNRPRPPIGRAGREAMKQPRPPMPVKPSTPEVEAIERAVWETYSPRREALPEVTELAKSRPPRSTSGIGLSAGH